MDYPAERNVFDRRSAESAQAAVDDFVNELRQLENNRGSISRDRIVELSSRYWNLLGEIIVSKCSAEDTERFGYTEEEERFFCFGAPVPDSLSRAGVVTKDDTAAPGLYCLSEWLRKFYLNLEGTVSAIQKRQRNNQLRSELGDALRQLERRRTFRDKFINLYCNDGLNEALLLAERMHVVYEDMVDLELMPKYGYAMTTQDTDQLAALHRLRTNLRKEFRELSDRIGEAGKLDAIERVIDKVEKKIERVKDIEFELRRAVEDFEGSAGHRRYISDRKKRISLVQELYDLRNKLESSCTSNNRFLKSVYLPPSKMVGIKTLRRIINRLIEFDPRIFNNMMAARNGVPDFLILPFDGLPFYDVERNLFIVPVVMREESLRMMAGALARYRVKIDYDFAMRDSYVMKREDRVPIRSRETNDMFVDDYILWQTRDSRGDSALSPQVRKWFEDSIAPYFNELRLLPGSSLRFDDEHDYDTMLDSVEEALAKNPEDKASRFSRGVLLSMAGSYAPAAAEFKKTLTDKPLSLESLYNYAIVSEMMNREAGAISTWKRYLSLDKGSWWRDNAEKHLCRLRSVTAAK